MTTTLTRRPSTLSIFVGEETSDNEPQRPAIAGRRSTLRQCFAVHVLPELDERAATTIEEYTNAIQLWERLTPNPAVCDIDRETVKNYRAKLLETPYKRGKSLRMRSPSTVNKIMRTLAAAISPLWPADRHNPGGLGLVAFFKWPEPLKRQKKLPMTFTRRQLSALYLACPACKALGGYRRSTAYDPNLWRAAIVLALNVGPRTWDLFGLKWSDIRWDDYRYGSVWFESRKTCKVQRVPLNREARKHLEHLRALRPNDDRVFPGFNKNQTFYDAWGRICKAAEVVGPFETFRKTCSTLHNDVSRGVGAFITGHEVKGVNAQFYDDPTRRVMRAVYRLKQPVEFRRGARSLAPLAK